MGLLFSISPFFIIVEAQSQIGTDYLPNVIPPSPNAAALMKFSDVPVSPYTGTADVTVPIYTIKLRGLDVPISISYHTGGVKLKEEASWVGLGWALNAGGMISRTIMDEDDFNMGVPYFTTAVPQLSGDMTNYHPSQPSIDPVIGNNFVSFFCNYLANTTSGNEDFTNAYAGISSGSRPPYDMEPDQFSYNFPGHSGKFILTRAGGVVIQKQENIAISFQGTGTNVSFTITDDQGNKFYFAQTETVQPSGSGQVYVSTWLLTKIVTELQDSATFNYTPGGASVSTQADINQTYAYAGICTQGSHPLTTYQGGPNQYGEVSLQSIVFNNGELLFYSDNKRSDLFGGLKLDSVQLYSKNAAGILTYQKQHNFYYTYFNSVFNPSYQSGTDSLEYLRLKLDSVKEVSGGISIPPYSFTYNSINPGLGSAKHSFNTDHWGYYNGTSNTTFIPTMTLEFSPVNFGAGIVPTIFTFTGGNRNPNLEFMEGFSLQQVNYPTGGYSVFNYQANDYDYTSSNTGPSNFQYVTTVTMDSVINVVKHGTTSGTIDLTYLFPQLPAGITTTNLTANVAFTYQNNYTTGNFPYSNTSNKIYFNFSGGSTSPISLHQDISGANCTSGTPVCSATIPLSIINLGVYNWSAYIDPSIDTVNTYSQTHISFQYQVTQQNYNLLNNSSFISPAGGLRIQNIINYNSNGVATSEKTYTYGYSQDKLGTGTPQQYSYGKLMSYPSYARYAIVSAYAAGEYYWCAALSLFSSSNSQLTSVIQGNIVGYSQVIEQSVDPNTGQDIGKTIYSYFNSPDTVIYQQGFTFPGCPNIGNSLNGLLLSKAEYADYDGNYQKVRETDNYYHTVNRVIYNTPRYQYLPQTSAVYPVDCTIGTGVINVVFASFYPSIKSERVLFDSTYSYSYDQNTPSNYVLSVNRNYYDNPVHYQVTRQNTIDSKGDTLVTKIKYPQDFIPSGKPTTGNTILDTMIGRNMVSETIEKQDSLYYPGSSSGYVTGAQLSLYRMLAGNKNTVIPDKVFKLDIQSPITNFQPFSFTNNTTSMDSRNRQMISFDQYDAFDNIQQYTTTDQNPVTIIWDYVNRFPIAQVKNAALADVAATSFEADGQGGWTFSGVPVSGTYAPTGNMYYALSSGAISKTGLTSTTTYIVSYWSSTGSGYSVSGSSSVKQGKTINGWTYFEHTVTGISSITVTGTGNIDELRLYPSTAQMTTYTYSSLVGMTTSCDADNRVTYYYYDGFGRLKWVKDQDGNIIKTYQYHYQNTGVTQY